MLTEKDVEQWRKMVLRYYGYPLESMEEFVNEMEQIVTKNQAIIDLFNENGFNLVVEEFREFSDKFR